LTGKGLVDLDDVDVRKGQACRREHLRREGGREGGREDEREGGREGRE
jgi:hypothetical protein